LDRRGHVTRRRKTNHQPDDRDACIRLFIAMRSKRSKLLLLAIILCLLAMGLYSTMFSTSSEGRKVEPYDAPRIEAVDQDGRSVKLADFYAKGLTLIYFYPKSGTPGCTKQACSLRDSHDELTNAGVQVIGVSRDKPDAQRKFIAQQKLPFTLLADPEGEVLKAFRVKTIPLIGLSTRQAILIKDGKVVWRDEDGATTGQAADVLRAVKELQQ
jgi:peroxiredoxin Q/BCP